MASNAKHDGLAPVTANQRGIIQQANDDPKTQFFDLPQELRDIVYSHFCPYSWFDIVLMPDKILQPGTSRVSRRMRKESLDVFYGKGVWFHDMRGWKNSSYPKAWTPQDIFLSWIRAIGDENAARIRRLRFYHHTFNLLVTITDETPRISYRLRNNRPGTEVELAEDAPRGYSFHQALKRAERCIARTVLSMNQRLNSGCMTAQMIEDMYTQIEMLKPSLCSRTGIGWKGAVFNESADAKTFRSHQSACGECAYYRSASV